MSKPAAKKLFRTSANVSEHLKLRALSYHCHMMIWNRPPLECILVHSRTRQRHPRSSGRPLSHHCWGFEVLGRSPNLLLRTQETLFICQNVTVPQHKWKLICVYTARCKRAPREKWIMIHVVVEFSSFSVACGRAPKLWHQIFSWSTASDFKLTFKSFKTTFTRLQFSFVV